MRISVLNKNMTVNFGSPHILRKSVVVILLLNLFLSIAGVSAQSNQIDCSKLAFSPSDLPTELQRYVTGQNFEVKSPGPEAFPEHDVNVKCGCESGFIRDVRILHKYFFNNEEHQEEVKRTAEKLWAALYVFENEDQARSLYNKKVEYFQNQEAKVPPNLNEKYGDESAGWIGSSPVQTLKGTPEGSMKRLVASFRVGPAVCEVISLQWYEDVPETQLNEESWDREIRFLDPLNCKDFGLKTLRNWSERLLRELSGGPLSPPPPTEGEPMIRIEMKSDKDGYYAGERVILSGSIQKLVNGKYVTYGSSKPFALKFEFPKGRALIGSRAERPGDRIVTDENGKFSLIPFAPYALGTYKITALLSRKDFPELKEYTQEWLSSDPCTFDVQDPPREYPANSQFVEIIRLFKNCPEVPPNNKNIPLTKLMIYPFVPPEMYEDEMNYGEINNLCYGFNGFHCAGYALKTMRFLNNLRFGVGHNDYERTLLRGIEYGPVMRGIPTEDTSGGEHYAVVLYNHWDYWLTAKDTRVLDPWPRQRPDNFTLQQFALFYGLDDIWTGRSTPPAIPPSGLVWDPRWEVRGAYATGWTAEAVPLLGSDVYWNLDWPQSPAKYPEDPLEGLEGISITGGSPIALDITDDKGEHVGLCDDGRLTAEIQRSQLFIHPTSQGDLSWYVWLPKGNYHVRIRGLEDGAFCLLTGKGDNILYCYNASIERNETATLELFPEEPDEPLTLPDGEKIEPKTIILEDGVTSDGQDGSRTRDDILLGGTLLAVIVIVLLLVTKRGTISPYIPMLAKKGEAKPAITEPRKPTEKTLTCPACATTNPSYSKYCVKCGGPVQQTGFCEECGRQIPAGSVYCEYCGDKQGVV